MSDARFVGEQVDADEFYVGYYPRAPSAVGRFVKRTIILAAALGAAVATLITTFQTSAVPSAWPGDAVSIRGYVVIDPYPRLIVRDEEGGGGDGGADAQRSIMLVANGKFGLLQPADYCGPGAAAVERALSKEATEQRAALREVALHYVELRGTILRREGHQGLEVSSSGVEMRRSRDDLRGDSVARLGLAVPAQVDLGVATLKGEIVDPKCFFGAMKPGHGLTHKQCAMRCISGGIAPVLVAQDAQGNWLPYVLTGSDGKPCNLRVMMMKILVLY